MIVLLVACCLPRGSVFLCAQHQASGSGFAQNLASDRDANAPGATVIVIACPDQSGRMRRRQVRGFRCGDRIVAVGALAIDKEAGYGQDRRAGWTGMSFSYQVSDVSTGSDR